MGNLANVKLNGEWREYYVDETEFPELLAWLERNAMPLFKRAKKGILSGSQRPKTASHRELD